MKNGYIRYDNPQKRKKSCCWPGEPPTSTVKPNIHGASSCFVFGEKLSVVYYELLQPNETITRERY